MHSRRLALLAIGAIAVLTACSSGPPEEDADKIADQAASALEDEIGQRPDEFDCGDEPVTIEEGETVDCLLTHGGTSIDAVVTISDVDGNDYRINVEVAQTPNP